MGIDGTHIINKQIIEFQLSKQMDSFKMQQAVSTLCKEQLEPIISALLDEKFGNTSAHYQIENLTIDLGEVTLETIPEQFSKKFTKALLEVNDTKNFESQVENQSQNQEVISKKTPLKILAYYVSTGRMPWWANNSKEEVCKQLDVLLNKPTAAFKKTLLDLHQQPDFIQRFVQTFTAEQLQKSMALLMGITTQNITKLKHEVATVLKEESVKNRLPKGYEKQFYISMFTEFTTNKNLLTKSISIPLRIDLKKTKTSASFNQITDIRVLIKICKGKHKSNSAWQQFFKEAQNLASKPSLRNLPIGLLKEFKQLLAEVSAQTEVAGIPQVALSKQVMLLKEITEQGTTKKAVTAAFEDTDFISIENAGLVVLWPFLPRFFENLALLENKSFSNEAAQYKAVSVLQYLCTEDETGLFEGLLLLAKVLCGIGVEELVDTYTLSEMDKEIAHNFLSVIIQQGKSWGKISVNGFRGSYLQRKASLRVRDDHWLLQVEKETYDIVLQKLPWSFNTIKLPWMEKLLMVEWI